METVYIILLFVAPGLFIKFTTDYFSLQENRLVGRTIFEQLFSIVLNSICITMITIFLIFRIHGNAEKEYMNINYLLEQLETFSFIAKYLLICIFTTVVWMLLIRYVFRKVIHLFRSRYLSEKYNAQMDSNNMTILQSILYTKRKKNENMFVSIYKDGVYITSGELRSWNQDQGDPLEWQLHHTYEVEKVIQEDKKRADNEKWLSYVKYEYFNIANGLLVKFYEGDYIIKHWDEI